LPRIEEPVVAAPADVNRFVEGGDHLTLRCELHDIDRLLTSVPIVVGTAGATELGFRTTKARMFPHSWNAVQAASNLPAESLIGEPPRFLVRCCPACRAAARKFLEAQALA
jgi:hypothetical protein